MHGNRKSTDTKKVSRICLIAVGALLAMKIIAGMLTGSVGIMADAIHSAIDLSGVIIGFIGIRIAAMPPDERHAFGHGRAEDIAGAVISGLIFVAAGGTLGILIPPSIPMIIYAALAEQSLGRLYLAGVVPGAVLSLLFLVYILVCCLQRPSRAPSLKEERVGLRQRLRALADLWQVLLLVVVILGGIYAGVATPTEVAAVGAVLAFILGVCFHGLTWPQFKSATISAIKATSMIMFIVVGAQMLSTSLIFFNVAPKLARFVSSLEVSPLVILAAVSMVYIIMGMFFDGISMMVITIPFVTPILEIMGINLIWFGIYLCILIEIGLITPPVGLNLYVIKGVTNENMAYIIWGAAPFIVPMVLLLLVLVIFPGLATWLPGLMNFG